jgi:CRP/FNR family transcriptional regulator, anaerobic regulatory protein
MKEFDNLIQTISKLVTLNQADLNALLSVLKYKEYKKESILTRENEIENYIYFITDGCLRNYCIHNGEDYSLDFYFKGSFTNSFMSFILREKSTVYVEALFDTNVLAIHYNDISRLYKSSLNLNMLGRIITESLYVKRTRREFSFITQSATERYQSLLCENRELVQLIPLKYLASYLGVKAESLSRIRATLKQNNKNASHSSATNFS